MPEGERTLGHNRRSALRRFRRLNTIVAFGALLVSLVVFGIGVLGLRVPRRSTDEGDHRQLLKLQAHGPDLPRDMDDQRAVASRPDQWKIGRQSAGPFVGGCPCLPRQGLHGGPGQEVVHSGGGLRWPRPVCVPLPALPRTRPVAINPDRNYWRNQQKNPGRWPGNLELMTRLITKRPPGRHRDDRVSRSIRSTECLSSAHERPRGSRSRLRRCPDRPTRDWRAARRRLPRHRTPACRSRRPPHPSRRRA